MEWHEAANIFPLDEEHLAELAEDIEREGLLCPIEVFNGKIIDGRRRWLACKKAGVKPEVVKVSPADPVAYVISLNLKRRQLTKAQAGACAHRAEKLRERYAEEAKERQKLSQGRGQKGPPNCADLNDKGDARDRLAEDFGVSHGTVDRAGRAIRDGIPELVEALDSGKITANLAANISAYPKSEQSKLLQEKLKKKQRSSSPAKPPATGQPQSQPKHELSETYAKNVADCAITELRRIPKANPYRARELSRVQSYLSKEL